MTITFDDLDDGLVSRPVKGGVDAMRAHIVNGGTTTQELVDCPKCGGSGRWVGGFTSRTCFRCDGKGKITVRSFAASKAAATRRANDAQFAEDNADVVAFLNANADWSDFFRSLRDQMAERGRLSDNQLAAVRRSMEKMAAKKAEKAAERVAAAPSVDVAKIEELFSTARANGKKTGLKLLAHGVEFAPGKGKNANLIWVTSEDVLQGKIEAGKFIAFRAAKPETAKRVVEVANDPLTEFTTFGKDTGICSCCGAELTNGVSISLGIGPICRGKWGL